MCIAQNRTRDFVAVMQLLELIDELLTQLQSTLDDDALDTRLLTCRIISQLLTHVGREVDQDRLHRFYPELLKRLDDSSNDVRLAAAHMFSVYMQCFHEDFNVVLYRAHIDAIYQGLLIHLDDHDSDIQLALLGELPLCQF